MVEEEEDDRSQSHYSFTADITTLDTLRGWVTSPLMYIALLLQHIRYVEINRYRYRFEQVRFRFVCGPDSTETDWLFWDSLLGKDLVPHVSKLSQIWNQRLRIRFSFRNPFTEQLGDDGFKDDTFQWSGSGLEDHMCHGVAHEYTDLNLSAKIYRMGFRFRSMRFYTTACRLLSHVLSTLRKFLPLKDDEQVLVEIANYCLCAPPPTCFCGSDKKFRITRFGPLLLKTVCPDDLHEALFQPEDSQFNIFLPFYVCLRVCQEERKDL